MYSSQHSPEHPPRPYYDHQGPNASQPQWRLPQSSTPPLPPAVTQIYNPGAYGYISGSPNSGGASAHHPNPPPRPDSVDGSKWGAQYNQGGPPPLPPRVPSSMGQRQSNIPPPVSPESSWAPTQSGNFYQEPLQTATQSLPPPPPPPPPPIPPEYQNVLQQGVQGWQQSYRPPYSDHPPTHRYDPPSQQRGQSVQSISQDLADNMNYSDINTVSSQNIPPIRHHQTPTPMEQFLPPPPPLPPPLGDAPGMIVAAAQYVSPGPASSLPPGGDPNTFAPSSSALGPEGPSDWEHFYSDPTHEDNTGHFLSQVLDAKISSMTVDLTRNNSPMAASSEPGGPPPVTTVSPVIIPEPAAVPHHSQLGGKPPGGDGVMQQLAVTPIGPSQTDAFDINVSTQLVSPESTPADESRRTSSVLTKGQSIATMEATAESSTVTAEPVARTVPVKAKKESRTETSIIDAAPIRDAAIIPASGRDGASVQPKAIDPYDDLDPWFRSSLVRYVAMLRKEATAESNEERYDLFVKFIVKETKLREVLYNIEPQSKEDPLKNGTKDNSQSKRAAQNKSDMQIASTESHKMSKLVVTALEDQPGLIPLESEKRAEEHPQVSKFNIITSDIPEESDPTTYSPGGRPILSGQTVMEGYPQRKGLHRTLSNPTGLSQDLKLIDSGDYSAGTGNRIGSFDSALWSSRSISVPPPSIGGELTQGFSNPPSYNPPEPAYVPFRYSEGPQRGSESLALEKPAHQAYSALRQASVESGRAMSFSLPPTSRPRAGTLNASSARSERGETFLGMIREKSIAYRGKRPESTLPNILKQGAPRNIVEQLSSAIPVPFPGEAQDAVNAIRREMKEVTDNFRYIQDAIEKWERSAKDRRLETDKERARRQDESEEQIDGLFNDREIGYADISSLEEEFRKGEARAQLGEERRELEGFIQDVFCPLDTRLKGETVKLRALYERAIDLLKAESSRTKEASGSKYQLAHLMKLVNELNFKLEARYQKQLDISLDRERRRKKAERRPLVFLGDSRALKQLDGDFDQMEKRNTLDAARDLDDRANRLMDFFDEAIMCGLGDHQRLLDDIAAKLRRLDIKGTEINDLPKSKTEQILRSVYALVTFLREDSESMLLSFGTVDSRLNDADYSVSIAEARYSKADAEIFRRLEEEKKKEDTKIQRDLDSKLDSVRKGPLEILTKINFLLEAMGKDPGPGLGPWEQPFTDTVSVDHHAERLAPEPPRPSSAIPATVDDDDPERKERLRKALEDAKRRNAAKSLPS